MKRFSMSLAIVGGLLVGYWAMAAESVIVSDTKIRRPVPGVKVAGGYFLIENREEKDLILVGVDGLEFKTIEMHETVTEDGSSKMRMLTEVIIPAGKKVEFRSGGKHLMLFEPAASIQTAKATNLTLKFKDKRKIEVKAIIE